MAEIGSSIAAKIAKYLVEPTLRQLRCKCCFNNNVKDPSQENRRLTVAQEQGKNDVNQTRGNAEEISKDVETSLTDGNTVIADVKSLENEAQENKSCLNGWCPNWCFRYRSSRKDTKQKQDIIKLQENSNFAQLVDPATLPSKGFFSSEDFLSSKATESATSRIIEALKDDSVNMIGLHGEGGIGKTTLVNELVGRAKELNLFNEVVKVVVSRTPNVENIQGQIADSLRLKFDQETEGGRASRLWWRLKFENKILIILDDVWDYLDLRDIGIPFGNHHKGCKILLTTCHERLCTSMQSQKTIKLDVLSEDEAWDLFKKNTVLVNDSSSLSTVAKKVARECKGLPLAIVTVGRALRGISLDEWKVALDQLKESNSVKNKDVDKEINPCLRLSYEYLKHKEIQSCFLLCSLFPEDYEINIEDLARIGWGIALFQEDKTIEEARREMQVMIKTLQDSGLLMGTDRDQFVKMHYMVRDVALQIASKGQNVFLVKTGDGLKTWPHDNSLQDYTAISLMANNIEELPNGLVCPNLNTLLLDGDGVSMTITDASFEGMKALNVLRIRRGILLPQSLQFLTNLQTLHLERCIFNQISSLGILKKLGILRLCDSSIVELPNEIGELSNLRLLDLNWCNNLERIPPNVISRLSKLEELYIGYSMGSIFSASIPDKLTGSWLWELNSLSRFSVLSLSFDAKYLPIGFSFPELARYEITMLNSIIEYPISRTLGIKDLDATSLNAFKGLFPTVKYLDLRSAALFQNIIPNMEQRGLNDVISLHLERCRQMECLIDSTQQLVPTTAFSNLENLSLKRMIHLREICFGNQPPEGFLQKLKMLKVEACDNICSIFPKQLLRGLLTIEEVTVHSCDEVQELFGLDELTHHVAEGNHVMLLSNLTSLYLYDLPELKCIWKGPSQHVSLKSLRDVRVSNCNRLMYVFLSSIAQSLLQLQRLTIAGCHRLEQIIIKDKEEGEISSEADLQSLCFPKLTTLKIIDCEKLEYIFPIYIAQGLQQLEELIVSGAPQLKQVFGPRRDIGDGNDIVLPKLRKLELERLSSLTSFYEGNYHWKWPSLQESTVIECPKLTTSFIADLRALQKDIISIMEQRGLNDMISLHLERCPEMEWLIDSTQQKVPPTAFSNLVNLSLNEMIDLREICYGNQPPEGFLHKLKTLKVESCDSIYSIFPKQLLKRLRNLEEVTVRSCYEVQELFGLGPTHHVAEGNPVMLLSNLTSLHLHDLPKLICIWKGPSQHVSLKSLRDVRVNNCNRLMYVFSSSLARSLSQLQRLIIERCHGLEQFINIEEEDGNISPEAHLQHLYFPKLTTLEIIDCERLEFIFPIYIARGLQQLQELVVSGAPKLKQVFGHGREKDVFTGDEDNILLPKLRKLKLQTLSSLTSFYEGNYHWMWPSLQELIVVECPKLTTYFIADLKTNLQALQKQLRVLRIGNHVQLHEAVILLLTKGLQNFMELRFLRLANCGVQEVFHGFLTDRDDELLVSNLEKLLLEDLPELRVIWKSPIQISCFKNLTRISVTNCKKLTHIFSLSLARNLLRLEYLYIRGCEELEQIIGEEDKDELKGHLQQPICFPNMKSIWVQDCNKLKSLFPISIARGLTQLERLRVERASQIEEVLRHENEEEIIDEKKIEFHQLQLLKLRELPRLISFSPGDYHFVFSSLKELEVKECSNIATSFTIDSNGHVHSKAKSKAETPQSANEGMLEGPSTTQAIVATRPSGNNINWNYRTLQSKLPPYMEESS